MNEHVGLKEAIQNLVSTTRERFDLGFAFLRAYLAHEINAGERITTKSDNVKLNDLIFHDNSS